MQQEQAVNQETAQNERAQVMKLALEVAPLVIFFGVNGYSGIFWGTGVFMAALFRSGAGWDMTGLGVFEDGRTVREMIGPAKAVLATLDRT